MPDLPLVAALRAHPEWRGRPVAIASGPGSRAEIWAVSPEARAAGIRIGSSLVHALATCAELHVRVASPVLERAARDALLDAALSTSPRVEEASPGTGLYVAEAAVFVDARGVGKLFHNERGFAGALALRAQRLGLPAVVAIAGSRAVARIAARTLALRSRGERAGPSPRRPVSRRAAQRASLDAPLPFDVAPPSGEALETLVIDAGSDAEFLTPLPLDLVAPESELADALGRFGMRRVGDLLRLPERSLTSRLGAGVAPLLRLARGDDDAPPPPAPESASFEESIDLEFPVQQLEPLLFALRGALSRLAERVQCRGRALGDLHLELGLEGGERDARSVGMAAPTLDVRVATRLLALSLEARPPRAAVDHLRIATDGSAARGDQLDFFRPAGPTPAALNRVLAELTALCGGDRVGAPAVADSHRPDAYTQAPFQGSADLVHEGPEPGEGGEGLPPARSIRPHVPARVQLEGASPGHIHSALASGRVLRCAGPYRTTGHWWSDDRYAFDHWDVATEDGLVCRLRWDLCVKRWEIDALYD